MSDACVTLSKLRESGFGSVLSYDSRAPYSHGQNFFLRADSYRRIYLKRQRPKSQKAECITRRVDRARSAISGWARGTSSRTNTWPFPLGKLRPLSCNAKSAILSSRLEFPDPKISFLHNNARAGKRSTLQRKNREQMQI